jgi:hypothetical protein
MDVLASAFTFMEILRMRRRSMVAGARVIKAFVPGSNIPRSAAT